jgi:hypothetical protein
VGVAIHLLHTLDTIAFIQIKNHRSFGSQMDINEITKRIAENILNFEKSKELNYAR